MNWTVRDLADRSGVHRNTITNFETERYAGSPDAIAAIRAALESAGVIFLPENGEGPGVRLRKETQ